MSNRKVTKDARPAYVADRIKAALEGRPVTTQAARDAIRIHGGPDVTILSRALLASHGVTQWETWKHATAAGRTVDRSQGVEVQGVRQPDNSAWGFTVFPMAPVRAAVAPSAPLRAVVSRKSEKPASKRARATSAALTHSEALAMIAREAREELEAASATRSDDKPVAKALAAKPGKPGKIAKISTKHAPYDWEAATREQRALEARVLQKGFNYGMGAADMLAREGIKPVSRGERLAAITEWNRAVNAMPGKSKPPTMEPKDYCDWVERRLPELVRADGLKPAKLSQWAA